jgi:SHS2 domain-containing protein
VVERKRRRLVDYPQNDFIATDLAFAKVWFHLVSEDVLKLIIQVYLKTGSYSLDSKLYSEYISNIEAAEIVRKYRELQRIAVKKAESVWKANVTFFALADVLQRYIELYLPEKSGGARDASADITSYLLK